MSEKKKKDDKGKNLRDRDVPKPTPTANDTPQFNNLSLNTPVSLVDESAPTGGFGTPAKTFFGKTSFQGTRVDPSSPMDPRLAGEYSFTSDSKGFDDTRGRQIGPVYGEGIEVSTPPKITLSDIDGPYNDDAQGPSGASLQARGMETKPLPEKYPALEKFFNRPDVKADMEKSAMEKSAMEKYEKEDPFSPSNIGDYRGEKMNLKQDFFDEMKRRSKKGILTSDDFSQAREELAKYEGMPSSEFNSMAAKNKIKPYNMRQDFFNKMKSLSGRGALTPEMYAQAREELGKYEGVSAEKFDSVMKKNRIQPSNFATAPKSSSPEEAAQNVMFEMEHGSALKAKAIKDNDPNYKEYVKKHGGVGIADQPARPVGPESGKLFNMARRMKRAGNPYWRQAHYAAETMRLKEPNIDTPELRRQRMSQKILAGKEAQRQDKAYASSAGAKLGQSGSGSRGEDVVTSYKPNPSDTDVVKEYQTKQASINKKVIDSMRSFGVRPA